MEAYAIMHNSFYRAMGRAKSPANGMRSIPAARFSKAHKKQPTLKEERLLIGRRKLLVKLLSWHNSFASVL
jgi:hypothetical protein